MEQVTAKQIHDDFYGAEERLYVEAIGLSKGVLATKISKAERLKKIGFGKAKPVKECKEQEAKRSVSGHLVKAIEYFRTYYPQNKFITEAEVKKLCEKYGLLLGETSNYIGDIPEKNLQDIEKFKLRREDWKEKTEISRMNNFGMFIPEGSIGQSDEFGLFQRAQRRQISRDRSLFDSDSLVAQYFALMTQRPTPTPTPIPHPDYFTGVDPFNGPEKKKEYEQPAFKICAPKEDFQTSGWEVRDGYRLVYDPIVLQPVSKDGQEGYLIVTAWGDEASDEIVVNESSN